MWRFLIGALVLSLSSAWAASAGAADKQTKMVPEEGAVEVMLLRQPSVQKELKLTDKEAGKIDEYAARQWKRAQAVSELDEKNRDKQFEEMIKENEHFVHQTLDEKQRQRLNEITLQVAGLLCVTRHDVASKLNLSDAQKTQAKRYQQEARAEVEELLYSASEEKKQEKAHELNETNRKRLMDLLTDDQEAKWKQMTGAPFKGEIQFEGKEKPRKTAAGG